MTNSNLLKRLCAATAVCLFIAASGYAQSPENTTVETTIQAGFVSGIGNHASLGGTAGAPLTERVFFFGEFSWIPLGGNSTSGTTPGGNFQFSSSGKVLTFMLGAQYRFRGTRTVVPYAGAALGALRASGSVTTTVGGETTTTRTSNSDLYLTLGGGARYYVNDHWGFKPELMIFAGSDSFVRLGGGIFYQFGR